MSAIDAVIAWVDGADPVHERKRRDHAGDAELSYAQGTAKTRFVECGEIYFCIASILKFAPFIRRIWIVTDQQRPVFLDHFHLEGICAADRIRVVDHREIFGPHHHALPTFNSLSIEAMLWRIPDLAERYVYFNDDLMLTAPMAESDFFKDERLVVYADWMKQHDRMLKPRLRQMLRRVTGRPERNRSNMRVASDHAARLLGETHSSLVPRHHPHPQRVSVQRQFYEANPEILRKQIAFRFRNKDQFLPIALSYMLEADIDLRGQDVLAMINARDADARAQFDAIKAVGTKFVCIQSLDCAQAEFGAYVRDQLLHQFAGYYPQALLADQLA